MICNLSPENFKRFGIILPEKDKLSVRANHHTLPLSPDSTQVYQSVADTYLCCESGQVVLSVSENGVQYQDYYLDRSVCIHKGTYYSLTAFQGRASVQVAGFSFPREIGTKTAEKSFQIRPQLAVTCLYAFLYHEKEQGFAFSGEAHDMAEMIYVDQGTLHCVADGKDLLVEQGDIVFYAPGQWHMQYADIGVAPSYVSICFDVDGCDFSQLIGRKFKPSQKVLAILQQLRREQEQQEDHSEDMILNLLNILLITLLRAPESGADKLQNVHNVNNENEIISRAQQYIGQHVREKLSVPVVARNTKVSASYLTALFQKHLQISPGEYIRRIKLQESKQMIREGEMNLTQISEALQYSTIHHFSRQFKEKFGITPSEYARSVR